MSTDNRAEPVYEEIPAALVESVCARLANDERVNLPLPGGGRLNIDRLLPFLCVYRRNAARQDAGTRTLVNGEAAYLNAPGAAPVRKGLRRLVRRIAETASARFGAFLIVEIWSAGDDTVPQTTRPDTKEAQLPSAAFYIRGRPGNRPEAAVNTLSFALQRVRIHHQPADVQVLMDASVHPPGTSQLLTTLESQRINCFLLGLEVRPIYRNPQTGELYPDVLRQLHHGVGRALKRTFYTFALKRTNVRLQHFYALGRRTLPKSVWEVDRRLAQVAAQFDLLLQVTPVNASSARQEFENSGFRNEPYFQYRPLAVDPLLLKRRLHEIRTEQLDDPTLAHLLRQTQDELDRQITMISDIGTQRFLYGSLQVFGAVETSLLRLATQLLDRFGPERREEPQVDAAAFAKQARREIQHYRRQDPNFKAVAEVRDDMYSGLMVSGGNLLIGRETKIPAHRVAALMQHEIGTHLVTYYNGLSQPSRLLSTGLAGYDGLQEGLAVLSEYLVGGLSRGRLRLLAARVVAAHAMIDGASFSETYRQMSEAYGFDARTAYTVTLRTYRGGGLTKDAVYLRGLVEILAFLARGGELDPLFVGKLAADHIPVIRELLLREVLRQPPLRPRYLDDPQAQHKLQQLKQGRTVLDLLDPALTSQ